MILAMTVESFGMAMNYVGAIAGCAGVLVVLILLITRGVQMLIKWARKGGESS